ncbi:TetR/AcrR family transcriptional regulator [Chelonobacter oris]|uniref:TetR/AcrR family transcriptional regulator n=1 Tax=Chelonobacter oris TaxID=505317 RepID=UPI000689509F|nr:TetR/AcrR family transcriptional regulator [Chelonobacter oris]
MAKTLNTVVKESITQALLRLMETQDFYAVSITDITKLAGVSRISFYRNFDSKEDVLIKHLQTETMAELAANIIEPTTRYIFIGIFHAINRVGELVDLLYARNLSHLFLAYIRACCGARPELDNETAHRNSLIMGICFGALDEWIRRGRQEDVEEMAASVHRLLDKIATEWDTPKET